ncbi:MAG: hypothetical protein KatS3mg102_2370 [Planctomycetota bacterium]|nr:MAG: hypothetical protein KatS3mg102_2370 [Planctomycetota bacterium]
MHEALRQLRDGEHLHRLSRFQDIRLASYKGHLGLLLDGRLVVHSYDAHRVYEALAVVPLLYRPPGSVRRVLIGGGGDGLAASRLLQFSEVQRVLVVDQDDEITAMARRPPMTLLNRDALADPRVEVRHGEFVDLATVLARREEERFELILSDLPAPRERPQERLYAPELYATLGRLLAPGGLLVVRAPFLPQISSYIHHALRSVFACAYLYRAPTQSLGMQGYHLAATEPIARHRGVPAWAEFLNERVVPALFGLAKDELRYLARPEHDDAVAAWRADHGLPTVDDTAAAAAEIAADIAELFAGDDGEPERAATGG